MILPIPQRHKKPLPIPVRQPAIPKRELFRLSDQQTLFDQEADWQKEWQSMPEFISVEQLPFHTVRVHFENPDDIKEFVKLVGQKITEETKYIWFPKKKLLKVAHLRYVDEEP